VRGLACRVVLDSALVGPPEVVLQPFVGGADSMFEGATTLAAIHRRLGARICGLAILHTWNRALMHHPRDQCVAPEGRLSINGSRWIDRESLGPCN
jgi:hypothetical protein